MGKITNKVFLLVLIVFIIIVGSNLFLLMKINFTKSKVEKIYFSKHYFVKANNKEKKIENFKEFMLMDGWVFIEIYNGTMIFRKGNLQKEISIDVLIGI